MDNTPTLVMQLRNKTTKHSKISQRHQKTRECVHQERGREREGEREGGREGGREGEREGGREGGKEGGRERGREGGSRYIYTHYIYNSDHRNLSLH